MHRFIYLLAYPVLMGISLLPYPLLYLPYRMFCALCYIVL